jgi:DNA-binding NarL/FixJ family response regulator
MVAGEEMRKIKVLIVDDNAAIRNGLCSILRAHADIELVGRAENGLEAIDQAERLQPDVILMDAQMPGMDGVETTRRIKERLPDIKILFLTVHTGCIKAALAAGADSYLMKDSGRQELLQAIRKLGRRV